MTPRTYPLFEKTRQMIFQNLNTWDNLVRDLQDLRLRRNEVIHVAVVGTNCDLIEMLTSEARPSGITVLSKGEMLNHFRLQRKFGREYQHTVRGQFIIKRELSYSGMYIFFSIAEPRFWRNGLLPFIDSLYPKAARPFLTQTELHALLKKVQITIQHPQLAESVPSAGSLESLPHSLRILELSSKKRLASTARKRFRTIREWTDADLGTVFRDAKEENVWFRSISFDLVKKVNDHLSSTGVRGTLSKYGYFSCTGNYKLFHETIVNGMLHYAAERLHFFSSRDRLSTPDHAVRPVEINYETDLFRSRDQAKRLVEALQRFKVGTCTVLHANPYVHVSLVDNTDFSAADVWVLSQNQILVVPQLKASEAALKRIVNHIFEHFREGAISEFQETAV